MALNDLEIRKAKPGAKLTKLSDGGGLQLWIMPDGKKYWLIAGASAYRSATAGRERRFVVSAARWLAEGRWRDAAPKPAAPLKEPGVWIADGSPEWRAWAVHWQETRGVSPPRDAKNGWRFPTLWPPSAVAAAV